MKKNSKTIFYDYLILYLLIATTAIPFFFDSQVFLLIALSITGMVFINRGLRIEKHLMLIFIPFLLLELFQHLYYNAFVLETFASIFIKLTFCYLAVRILSFNYFTYYINLIKTICLISLFFYLLCFIPSVFNLLYTFVAPIFKAPFHKVNEFYAEHKTIIVYTLDKDLVANFRNPGPFWEPGIFSIFILIALLFNTIQSKSLINNTNGVLLITLFTTISTTGILGFFLFLFAYYYIYSKSQYKLFHILILVTASVYVFFELSFLSEKVELNIALSDQTGSRFGSFMADWRLFKESPFIGWGRGKMRFGENRELFFSQESHRNNGISALLTQYGLIFTLFYFTLYYYTFRVFCKKNNSDIRFALFCLIIILFVGFSQTIFTRQFFLSFLFIGILFRNNLIIKLNASRK